VPPMTSAERSRLAVADLLAQERSKEKAARILTSRGLSAAQAMELVDSVFCEIRGQNRKTALGKVILSFLGIVVFGGIFLATGRLFFIILPLAGIGLLWGGIQWLTASGFEVAVDSGGD
jgi:hypothetical protein